jgi:ABC-type transport system involved in cytochrome bd biosynthesis fused ATPase/permease subunit
VGLGAVVVAITSAAALDVTGVLAGLVIVGLGLYIIPARRRRAQQRFSQESEELRQHLDAALTEQFSRQLDGALVNLRAALAPYVRFVRAEHERVTRFRDDLSTLQGRIRALRHEIEG